MEQLSTALARWLPVALVWSAVLISVLLNDATPARVVLARQDIAGCPALP